MPLAESLGQATEVQFWLTSKLSGICPAYTPTKKGILFDELLVPVIFRSSRDAVISTRVRGHNMDEEAGRKMHAHSGSRCHLRPSIFKLTSLWAKAQFGLFKCVWSQVALHCTLSKNQAKVSHIKLLHGIKAIRLYGEAAIEEQGKLSSCYEKNISQDTTCRKVFVIGCTEKVLSGLGLAEVRSSVWKKISAIFGR